MPAITCPGLVGRQTAFAKVNLDRWSDLHEKGRQLITGWFDRSAENSGAGDPFEGFIYLWIAFNGWASCVTELERDRDWIDALTLDPRLCESFARLTVTGAPLETVAGEFFRLLPIFKATSLRRLGLNDLPEETRDTTVSRYLHAGACDYDPPCYKNHLSALEPIPVDWPHALVAIYRVRNNLFHGQKTTHIENDRRIVSTAYELLLAFLRHAELLGPKSIEP